MKHTYTSQRGWVAVIVLVTLTAYPAFGDSTAATDVRSEITSLLNEYFVHRNDADYGYFERFYAPDVITVYSGKLADGREALTKTVHNFIGGETDRATKVEDLIVTPRRNIGWVRFTMHNTSRRGDSRQDSRLFTTMAFEKVGQNWRCFFVSAAPAGRSSPNQPRPSGVDVSPEPTPQGNAGASASPESSGLRQSIETLLSEYFVHRNRGDLEYFQQFYTPDVVTVHSGKLADGRGNLVKTLRGFIEGRTERKTEIEDLVITVYEDTVWARYTMHNTWTKDGKRGDIRLFTTMGFERTGPNRFRAFTVAAAPQRAVQQQPAE